MRARQFWKGLLLALALGAAPVSGGAAADEQPEICGGIAGKMCSDGKFCDFPVTAQCGAGDQTGLCAPKPQACTLEYVPVCGCDDKTYANDCARRAAGVAKVKDGECAKS